MGTPVCSVETIMKFLANGNRNLCHFLLSPCIKPFESDLECVQVLETKFLSCRALHRFYSVFTKPKVSADKLLCKVSNFYFSIIPFMHRTLVFSTEAHESGLLSAL